MSSAVSERARQRLIAELDVSRETLKKLDLYVETLLRWQRRINLVAPATVEHVWERHILDSAQIARLLDPEDRAIADFGTGAGLPGMIMAIMTQRRIDLVESDQRKAAFLREAARVTSSDVIVHNLRIEALEKEDYDVVVARALAPLDRLLELAVQKIRIGGRIIAPKGKRIEEELTQANKRWTMSVEFIPSLTASDAKIAVMRDVKSR
jgi:16S rRNA (guanine527-N7)-methyltransferase